MDNGAPGPPEGAPEMLPEAAPSPPVAPTPPPQLTAPSTPSPAWPPQQAGGAPPAWAPPPPAWPPQQPAGWGAPPPPPGWGAPPSPPGWGTPQHPAGWGAPLPPPGWPGAQQPPGGYPLPPPQGWWPGGPPPPLGSAGTGSYPGWDRAASVVTGTGRFRTMSLPELIDGAFTLYRLAFWPIVALAALVAVPEAGLTWLLSRAGDISGRRDDVRSITNSISSQGYQTQAQHDQLISDIGGLITVVAGLLIVSLIARQLAVAALSPIVSDRYLGRPSGFAAGLRQMARRFLPLLAGEVIVVLVIAVCIGAGPGLAIATGSAGLGAVVFLAGLAVLAVTWFRWLLMPQAIVLEGVGPIAGLRRSWALTRRRYWRTVGIYLLLGLVIAIASSVVSAILTLPFSGAPVDVRLALQAAAGAISGILVAPVGIVAYVLYYYDARIRSEAFDLEMLAAAI